MLLWNEKIGDRCISLIFLEDLNTLKANQSKQTRNAINLYIRLLPMGLSIRRSFALRWI